MRNLRRIFAFAFLFVFPLSLAWSADDDSKESSIHLGDLLITPERIPGLELEESQFPGNATVITEKAIQSSAAPTVTDLLAKQEGVHLADSRGFGLGADSGVTLRGFSTGSRTNALVLVDGVRQNRITGDDVHWQAIPIEQIERIEILRGGTGTIYGEGALSGVINIITKKGGTKPIQMEGNAEAGSYRHVRATEIIRGTEGKFSYNVGVTRALEGGYRDNTSSRATTVNFFTGWNPTESTQLELHANDHQDTSGFAGGLTTARVEQDRRNHGSFFGFFNDHLSGGSFQITQKIGAAWTGVSNVFVQKRDTDSVTTSRFGSVTSTEGAGFRASHLFTGAHWKATTVFGTDLAQDKAVTGDRSGAKSESNRWGYGLFAEEIVTFFERLSVTLGYRYDRSRYEEDLTFPTFAGTLRFSGSSPKIGVNYSLTDQVDLFANASQAFKAPNIDDLDAVLPPFNDSVDVKPQRAKHAEVGVRWKPSHWFKIKTAGFFARTKDEIIFDPATFANTNFTTQRSGLELNVSGEKSPGGIGYYTTYTFTKAHFYKGQFTGYEIPGTPVHQVTTGIHCPVTKRFSIESDYRWVGRQFRINDFNNRFPAGRYSVVDLILSYQFPWKLQPKAYLKIFNLLDEEYESFPSSAGSSISTGENPAPPRTWVAGISWSF